VGGDESEGDCGESATGGENCSCLSEEDGGNACVRVLGFCLDWRQRGFKGLRWCTQRRHCV
jgi:hypothetical protein